MKMHINSTQSMKVMSRYHKFSITESLVRSTIMQNLHNTPH